MPGTIKEVRLGTVEVVLAKSKVDGLSLPGVIYVIFGRPFGDVS